MDLNLGSIGEFLGLSGGDDPVSSVASAATGGDSGGGFMSQLGDAVASPLGLASAITAVTSTVGASIDHDMKEAQLALQEGQLDLARDKFNAAQEQLEVQNALKALEQQLSAQTAEGQLRNQAVANQIRAASGVANSNLASAGNRLQSGRDVANAFNTMGSNVIAAVK